MGTWSKLYVSTRRINEKQTSCSSQHYVLTTTIGLLPKTTSFSSFCHRTNQFQAADGALRLKTAGADGNGSLVGREPKGAQFEPHLLT